MVPLTILIALKETDENRNIKIDVIVIDITCIFVIISRSTCNRLKERGWW